MHIFSRFGVFIFFFLMCMSVYFGVEKKRSKTTHREKENICVLIKWTALQVCEYATNCVPIPFVLFYIDHGCKYVIWHFVLLILFLSCYFIFSIIPGLCVCVIFSIFSFSKYNSFAVSFMCLDFLVFEWFLEHLFGFSMLFGTFFLPYHSCALWRFLFCFCYVQFSGTSDTGVNSLKTVMCTQ